MWRWIEEAPTRAARGMSRVRTRIASMWRHFNAHVPLAHSRLTTQNIHRETPRAPARHARTATPPGATSLGLGGRADPPPRVASPVVQVRLPHSAPSTRWSTCTSHGSRGVACAGTERGGKGARVHVQRCSGGLARPSERGRGAGRGEGEGKLHPYGMYARPRAHTVLGALFSVQCQLSVFSSAPASRCLALRAHATPQSLPRACSMHRQKYSICEVKQLRGPDDLVYTC